MVQSNISNHNQIVTNMLYEIDPDYDNLCDSVKEPIKKLVEIYLDPAVPETMKTGIINELLETKILLQKYSYKTLADEMMYLDDAAKRLYDVCHDRHFLRNEKHNKQSIRNTDMQDLISACNILNETIVSTADQLKSISDMMQVFLHQQRKDA